MNQIEEIKKLYTIEHDYKIGQNEVLVKIKELDLNQMSLLDINEDSTPAEIANSAIAILSASTGMDKSQISRISVKYLQEIMGAFKNANNFDDKDMKKTGINQFIESKVNGKSD